MQDVEQVEPQFQKYTQTKLFTVKKFSGAKLRTRETLCPITVL